jgi:hypothetical protein
MDRDIDRNVDRHIDRDMDMDRVRNISTWNSRVIVGNKVYDKIKNVE